MTTAASKTTEKKAPVTPKKKAAKTKMQAKGFANWSVQLKDGSFFNSSKGFPIFQNPEYPNPQEDELLRLAEENGGTVEIPMTVTIRVNKPAEERKLSLGMLI